MTRDILCNVLNFENLEEETKRLFKSQNDYESTMRRLQFSDEIRFGEIKNKIEKKGKNPPKKNSWVKKNKRSKKEKIDSALYNKIKKMNPQVKSQIF